MAAAILTETLSLAGVHARVESAGTRADGQPAVPEVIDALARRGLALERIESRQLMPADVAGADLVLGMERDHVREAVMLAPEAWPRTFTLKEIVRRGAFAGPRPPEQSMDEWLARVAGGRKTADLLGADPADDVADPIGRPVHEFETTADELADLSRRLAHLLAPPR